MAILFFLLLGYWSQTDWSGGGGQPSWIDSTKYFNKSHISHSRVLGGILLDAPDGWTDTGELPANHIWALIETRDSIIYAGGDSSAQKGFVFKSENLGNTWTNTNILSCNWVHALLESHADTLYAGTNQGVFKYAGSWLATGLTESVNALLETRDSIFYAGTWNGEIWKSLDGNSWNKLTVNNGVRIWDIIEAGDTLYAAGTRKKGLNELPGVFKSGDGTIFDTTTFPHVDKVVYSLLLADDSTIYAGTGPDSGKVFKTQDGGNVWDTTQTLEYAESIYSLLQGDGTIYAGTGRLGGYLYKSTDGQSWSFEQIDATISTIYSLLHTPDNGFLYAGTNKGVGSSTSVWRAGYFSSGWLKSSSFEASVSNEVNYDSVFWDADLNGGAIEVWIRTNTEGDMWGTDSFKLSPSGDTIPDAFDGKGYIQYKVKFSSPTQDSTPVFKYIGINYFPSPATEEVGTRHSISLQVYPNPFTQKASIRYSLNKNLTINDLRLTIHDIAGRLIREFPINDYRLPITEITWDARKVPSGVYFAKLTTGKHNETKKLVILR
ncbi:T9SS type A sorting domain-containing protein [candidate division WOR-3 bacterium]|nr:T9SS type A sorting domain-containing protein [candidate division WOR-3 bacterium]